MVSGSFKVLTLPVHMALGDLKPLLHHSEPIRDAIYYGTPFIVDAILQEPMGYFG